MSHQLNTRTLRRCAPWLAVVLLAAACASDDPVRSAGTDARPIAAPQLDSTADWAADQALADSALLRLEDLPPGWSETASREADPTDAHGAVVDCVGAQGHRGAGASSGVFSNAEYGTISHSVSVMDLDRARDFLRRLGADAVRECLLVAVRGIEAKFTQSADLLGGLSIGEVTVDRLDVAAAGEVVAYRVRIPFILESAEIDLVIDQITVRVGRVVSGLSFLASPSPFTVDDIDRYVALAIGRIPTAPE